MLSAAQLTAMRTQHEATFDQTATKYRRTVTNGAGGPTETYNSSGTFSCHIREEGTPHEVTTDGAMRAHTFFIVWAPHGTDLQESDKLVIGGYTYQITGLDEGKSYPLNVQARCVRVEGL
jgi:hypothetical protein